MTRQALFKVALFTGLLLLVFGVGLGAGRLVGSGPGPVAPPNADAQDAMSSMPGMEHMPGMTMGSGSSSQGLRASEHGYNAQVERTERPAAQDQEFRFTIVGPDGRPVTDFTPSDDKLMHLVVVRSDLREFQHLHPTMSPDGRWTQQLTLPTPGRYRAYMEFLTNTREVALAVDLTVPGDYRRARLPEPSSTATVDSYTVSMTGNPLAGTDTPLTFHITRRGTPETRLQPYLGAFGHLVAIRNGDLAYLRIHPKASANSGPDVVCTVISPDAGTYRLYFQFQTDGVVHTAEFTAPVGTVMPTDRAPR